LRFQVLLDLAQEKIIENLDAGSWLDLNQNASGKQMSPRNYIRMTYSDIPQDIIDIVCGIDCSTDEYAKLEKLQRFVYD
jgi:hypothetical protein